MDVQFMRECEIFSSLKVPCGSKILLRLDGRGFYKLSKQMDLEKPYDPLFVNAMVNSAVEIFKEFSPAFIYTFSDEINILLADIPFSGRIEKLDSVFASFTANSFFKNLIDAKIRGRDDENEKLKKVELDIFKQDLFKDIKTISFDCRIIPLSSEMVFEYFKERQDEAWRNCINGYAYWTLRNEMDQEESMKILNGLKADKIHDILFKRGINIGEVPVWQRRGVALYKVDKKVKGYNPFSQKEVESARKVIYADWNLPRFTTEFFDNIFD